MSDVVTDFRGNTFTVGDTVLYPRMSGRSCEIQEGVVLELKPFKDTRSTTNPNFDPDQPPAYPDNMRWISEDFTNYKVRIQPTRSTRFDRTWYGSETPKPVWIQIGENVVKA